jgi:hypothetical protein
MSQVEDRRGYEEPWITWMRAHIAFKDTWWNGQDIDLGLMNGCALSIGDIHPWENYTRGDIMLIEGKMFQAKHDVLVNMTMAHKAQQTLHYVLDWSLRTALSSVRDDPDLWPRTRYMLPGRAPWMRYRGYFFVQFGKTTPDDGWVRINGEQVSTEEFLSFLKFEHIRKPYEWPVLYDGGS